MKNNIPIELRNAAGIYEIRNLINGKVYVGSAALLNKRYRDHASLLRKGNHRNPYLLAASKKYGNEVFVFNVVCTVERTPNETFKDRLLELENHYIKEKKAHYSEEGYNIRLKADSNLGMLFPGSGVKGEANAMAKLTAIQVLEVTNLVNEGKTTKEIIATTGLKWYSIYSIKSGKAWSHLTGIAPHNIGKKVGGEHCTAKLTNEDAQNIYELIQTGKPLHQIAKEFGVAPGIISTIKRGVTYRSVTDAEIIRPGCRRKLTDKEVLEICRLLDLGVLAKTISQKFGIVSTHIMYIDRGLAWAKLTGRPDRPFGGVAPKPLSNEKKQEIAMLLKQGLRCREIANKTGVHESSVVRVRRKLSQY